MKAKLVFLVGLIFFYSCGKGVDEKKDNSGLERVEERVEDENDKKDPPISTISRDELLQNIMGHADQIETLISQLQQKGIFFIIKEDSIEIDPYKILKFRMANEDIFDEEKIIADFGSIQGLFFKWDEIEKSEPEIVSDYPDLDRIHHIKKYKAVFTGPLEAIDSILRETRSFFFYCKNRKEKTGRNAITEIQKNSVTVVIKEEQVSDCKKLAQILSEKESIVYHGNFSFDLSLLRGLEKLEDLWIRNSDWTIRQEFPVNRDLSPLKYSQKIKELSLIDIEIADVSLISSMKYLERLKLGNNMVKNRKEYKIKDIQFLKGVTNLVKLDLRGNLIEDISEIQSLKDLVELNLENNEIKDIESLRHLTKISDLKLGENKIKDISPLKGITDLRCVSLNDNLISDLSPLADLKINCGGMYSLINNPVIRDKNHCPTEGNSNLLISYCKWYLAN